MERFDKKAKIRFLALILKLISMGFIIFWTFEDHLILFKIAFLFLLISWHVLDYSAKGDSDGSKN